MKLEEEEPVVLEAFIKWLYTNELYASSRILTTAMMHRFENSALLFCTGMFYLVGNLDGMRRDSLRTCSAKRMGCFRNIWIFMLGIIRMMSCLEWILDSAIRLGTHFATSTYTPKILLVVYATSSYEFLRIWRSVVYG